MKINELKTPCYVIDEGKLTENLKILHHVMQTTGAKILLAQKAFSAFCEYPLIGKYLSGTTASGLYEARLAQEEMGKENHVFCPAYLPEEMDELVKICDHIVFNSVSQFLVHKEKIKEAAAGVSTGLRINPECSTQEGHEIYDPCGTGSRLGITRAELDKAIQNGFDLSQIDGFHFHTLCEQNSDALETTLDAVEKKFGDLLYGRKWLNMGGGHHITKAGYDMEKLENCIRRMQETYDLEIYLEPGEAVALNAGYLETTVLDIVENNGIKDGKKKSIYIYNVCDHQECYKEVESQAVSYTTGVPAMIGSMMVVTGLWKKPGVFNLEEMDPDPYMEALNKFGLPWKVVENPVSVDCYKTADPSVHMD